jgi:WD40 repeat protein
VKFWDVEDRTEKTPVETLDVEAPVTCLSWRRLTGQLALGLAGGEVLFCDSRGGSNLRRKHLCEQPLAALAWHPEQDGAGYIAAGHGNAIVWIIEPTRVLPISGCSPHPADALAAITAVDPRLTARHRTRSIRITASGVSCCHRLAWSPGGMLLAIAGERVAVFDFADTGALASAFTCDVGLTAGPCRGLVWHPEGTWLAAAYGRRVAFFSAASGDPMPPWQFAADVMALAIHEDGSHLAVGFDDGTIAICTPPAAPPAAVARRN